MSTTLPLDILFKVCYTDTMSMSNKTRKQLIDEIEELTENKLDPRQQLCWTNYIDHTSKTFSNIYASAIAAGYTHFYSRNISQKKWFRSKMRRSNLLTKSEKIMNKILNMESEKSDVLRVQSDVAKHITKTLGRDEGYSERSEQVGNGVVFLPIELIEKFNLTK